MQDEIARYVAQTEVMRSETMKRGMVRGKRGRGREEGWGEVGKEDEVDRMAKAKAKDNWQDWRPTRR